PALLQQTQRLPRSSWVDPGLFAELSVPVNDRLKVRAGGRVDFVSTSADQSRLITGNVDLFGAPTLPGPLSANRVVVDPIVYSSNPNDPSTDRTFGLFSGFLTSEYIIDEHLTAIP